MVTAGQLPGDLPWTFHIAVMSARNGQRRSWLCDLAEVLGMPADAGCLQSQDWLQGLGINTHSTAFAELGIQDADARVRSTLSSPRASFGLSGGNSV
jgi:hypothetical protein